MIMKKSFHNEEDVQNSQELLVVSMYEVRGTNSKMSQLPTTKIINHENVLISW